MLSTCFLTILFLPRRSWKRRRKPRSPRLQSGWSTSSAACPEQARVAEEKTMCRSSNTQTLLFMSFCCSIDTLVHQKEKKNGNGLPLAWQWRQGRWRQWFHTTSSQKPAFRWAHNERKQYEIIMWISHRLREELNQTWPLSCNAGLLNKQRTPKKKSRPWKTPKKVQHRNGPHRSMAFLAISLKSIKRDQSVLTCKVNYQWRKLKNKIMMFVFSSP